MRAVNISISIPETMLNQLNKICDAQERTKSYLVKKALEKYFTENIESKKEDSFTTASNKIFAEEWAGKEDEKAFAHLQKYHKTK